MDALALGAGTSGSGAASVNPEAQMQYFTKFHGAKLNQGQKRKFRTVSVGAQLGSITTRYRRVAMEFYAGARHIAVCLNGSRVGGQDLVCGAVAATVGESTLACWAPPQVIGYFGLLCFCCLLGKGNC